MPRTSILPALAGQRDRSHPRAWLARLWLTAYLADEDIGVPRRGSGIVAGIPDHMGDFPHYFDIILFAMVAAFLVLRLRSVLGRRTGQEGRPDPVLRRAEAPGDN